MKKKLKYIFILIALVSCYVLGGKILDKLYLSKYHIVDYMGDNRFSTVNTVMDKKYKKADECFFVNTNSFIHAISLAPYAYAKNIPVFYIEKNRIPNEVYEQMKKLGINKVYIIGGVNNVSEAVDRSLDRSNIPSERIVQMPGIDFSIEIAKRMNEIKKINTIAVVTDDKYDVPNGITFVPYADRNNIPIFVVRNNEDDLRKLYDFTKMYNIKRTYLIGNNEYYNKNFKKILPDVIRISGENSFEIDRNIMKEFYKNTNHDKVYVSQGGDALFKKFSSPGQFINALAITTLAADNNAPIMYIENNYFSTEDQKLIEEYGYKEINEVGFNIKRRSFFNAERFKTPTTVMLIIISLIMMIRVLLDKRADRNLGGRSLL